MRKGWVDGVTFKGYTRLLVKYPLNLLCSKITAPSNRQDLVASLT
jgi:hypothetical protein